ncbi:MAG: hypothetical protein KF891_08365 [Rhizobacter sp.]|nr:hypothetical protein [Rhizobacter sp.]
MIPLKKNSNSDYTARYLVLLGDEHATRALLFARDSRYLAEVIDDDGLVLDDLMKCGTACPPPGDVARQAWANAPATVQCFALDERRCNG